ncbi:TolB-like translocation protein [Rhizosphaericola mali]|uniref:Uncharacterized protein n=1 Tax=Rhizosphaericola mali TaxID=2545455 RepID=A0A5P2G8B5_9BACT|nr:hypothetical protein [Rhizosphaericola mali]QES87761.1 hypothetical protein E0W69_003455 [Rhizosphaericola mali]
MKVIFYLIVFFLSVQIARSQVFGGNPFHVNWHQVHNPYARIIYPDGQDSAAQLVSNLIRWQGKYDTSTIGSISKKIDIVLQPDVVYSNGYVQLGPFRSEFYLMPSLSGFELGSQNWTSNLAVHEFRHVLQYNNFNVGLSKFVGKIFGQDGRDLANAMSVPNWFFEGDAVYNETKLSGQGRGRLPLFMNDFYSLYLGKKHYNYQQLRNGSYIKYVPNHYPLGYLLVGYGYQKYGEDFWKNVTKDAAAYKPLFYPLQNAVKKYAGVDFDQFVQNAFSYYQSQWDSVMPSGRFVQMQKKWQIDNAQYLQNENNNIFYVKTSYKHLPSFYTMDSNFQEMKIKVQSITYDNYFSTNGKQIVYAARVPNIRWGNVEYSDIKVLDIASKKEKYLTKKTRYFTPDIDKEGNEIAAVSINTNQQSQLVVLDNHGKILSKHDAAKNHIYSFPKFSPIDHSIFVFERDFDGKMRLVQFSDDLKTEKELIPFGNRIMGFPYFQKENFLFTATSDGKDVLFSYDVKDKSSKQISSFPTGIYGGVQWKDSVLGSVFTADGYRLRMIPKERYPTTNWANDTFKILYLNDFSDKYKNIVGLAQEDTATVSKYARLTHPFNFHSLHPEWDDPNYTLSYYGNNVLNTVQSQLYYNYNRTEKFSSLGASVYYGGWYVMPFIGVNTNINRQVRYNDISDTIFRWNDYTASAGLQLPLNFSRGRMYKYLNVSTVINYNQVAWNGIAKNYLNNRSFYYLNNTISFQSYSQQATQNIYPRLGYVVSANYRSGLNLKSYQWVFNSSLYLPGLMTNHNLVVNAAYSLRDTLGNYLFSNIFPFSRGYQVVNFPRMWKVSGNYHLPLFYPDWGYKNIVYFQRIRGNLFYDYTEVKSLRTKYVYHFRTIGSEIYFDTKWWNQEAVTFGIRYSYMQDHKLLGTGPSRWEIILPINLFD